MTVKQWQIREHISRSLKNKGCNGPTDGFMKVFIVQWLFSFAKLHLTSEALHIAREMQKHWKVYTDQNFNLGMCETVARTKFRGGEQEKFFLGRTLTPC